MISIRLLDVFLVGPLEIYTSCFIKNKLLRLYLLLNGILVILFNGYNYLHFEKKFSVINIKVLDKYSDPITGKPQCHRFILLSLLYPIHLYIILTEYKNIPMPLLTIFTAHLVISFTYNYYNFVKYL